MKIYRMHYAIQITTIKYYVYYNIYVVKVSLVLKLLTLIKIPINFLLPNKKIPRFMALWVILSN